MTCRTSQSPFKIQLKINRSITFFEEINGSNLNEEPFYIISKKTQFFIHNIKADDTYPVLNFLTKILTSCSIAHL